LLDPLPEHWVKANGAPTSMVARLARKAWVVLIAVLLRVAPHTAAAPNAQNRSATPLAKALQNRALVRARARKV
jgi:predicted cobalt transporter CbtA